MNPSAVNPAYLVFSALASLLNIVFPIVVAVVAHRKLRLGWRYLFYGALIFLAFQLVTRVPLVLLIQAAISPQLLASKELQFAWAFVLALTAALTEEIGRWLGYRVFMRREEKTWGKGVLYGIGHGALEAVVLVGGLGLLTVVNLAVFSSTNLDALPLSPEQRQLALAQIAAINALPAWLPLLGTYERVWAMAVQVGLSILVLQMFVRGGVKWLWLAIGFHFALDLVAVGLPLLLPGVDRTLMALMQEASVTVAGLIGLWIVWRFKPSDAEPKPPPEPTS